MAGAISDPEVPRHVIPIDNTLGLLEALRDDPFAVASCNLHNGTLADVIFLDVIDTPSADRRLTISAFCGQHILKGEGVGLFPLLDQTGGYWTERQRYSPLFTGREDLRDYEAALMEWLATLDSPKVVPKDLLRTIVARLRRRQEAPQAD